MSAIFSLANAAVALVHDGMSLCYLETSCEQLLLLENSYTLATHVRMYLNQCLHVDHFIQITAVFETID